MKGLIYQKNKTCGALTLGEKTRKFRIEQVNKGQVSAVKKTNRK